MAAAQSELSMDEILASIRRIIDEEERPAPLNNPDKTNTVSLREESQGKTREPEAPAPSEPAEQVREAQVTSTKPAQAETAAKHDPAPAPEQEAPVATMEPDAVATEAEETVDETFDPAPLKELARAEPAAKPKAASSAGSPSKAAPASSDTPATIPAEVRTDAKTDAPAGESDAESAEKAPQDRSPAGAPESREELKAKAAEAIHAISDHLIDEKQSAGIAAAFASLKGSMQVGKSQQTNAPQTLEGLVQEMLRPMLKAWLEENLPAMVEKKVEAEIKRLTAQG